VVGCGWVIVRVQWCGVEGARDHWSESLLVTARYVIWPKFISRQICKNRLEKFVFGFWFLVSNAATQLALQLHQDRIQMVRSNEVVRRLPTESNSNPAMELALSNIRIRTYTSKRGTEQNTPAQTHTVLLLL